MGIKINPFTGLPERSGNSYDKNYYPTEAALNAALPVGEAGWKAVVGETDTVWIWDTDTSAWVDSGAGSGNLPVTTLGTSGAITIDRSVSDKFIIPEPTGAITLAASNFADSKKAIIDIVNGGSNITPAVDWETGESDLAFATSGTTRLTLESFLDEDGETVKIFASTKNLIFSPRATGGNITYSGGYAYHTFTENGTFTPLEVLSVDYLIIAGGGGGGSSYGGGGGAGGVITGASVAFTAQAYPVVIGAGGASNTNGSNTTFNSLTAIGGGYGGAVSVAAANSGGSGGGGCPSPTTAGTGTAGQGNDGGAGGSNSAGGGGGGAGAVGVQAPDSVTSGNGGAGIEWLDGNRYAGGGGGGNSSTRVVGIGQDGGGNGANGNGNTGGAATANTGGGGGGGSEAGTGGAGGSGVVIIRYAV